MLYISMSCDDKWSCRHYFLSLTDLCVYFIYFFSYAQFLWHSLWDAVCLSWHSLWDAVWLYGCVLYMKETQPISNVPVNCCCMDACAGCPRSLCFHSVWISVCIECLSALDQLAVVIDDSAVYCFSLWASYNWKVWIWSHLAWITIENSGCGFFFVAGCFLVSGSRPSHNASSRAVIDHAQRRVSAGGSACSWETMAGIVRLEERKSCWLWYVTEQQMHEWMNEESVCVCSPWKYERGGDIRKWTASKRKQQSRYYSLGGWKRKKETYGLKRESMDGGKWRGLVS